MIDFGALVLGPSMMAFARPITITPLASQPNAAAYSARGVYALKPVQIALEETDSFHQGFQAELGVRVSEFLVLPTQGDRVAFDTGTYEIANVVPDGQGGAVLVLRKAT